MPPAAGLFDAINRFATGTPWLHSPMAGFATFGILVFGGFIVAGWWLARTRGDETMACVLLTPVAALVAFLAQQVIVSLVDESRPYALRPDALVLIARTTDPSFPSDHACVCGAVAAALFFVDRRLGWTAATTAALMAFARVYVGAHWPLDVVAGLAVGAATAIVLVLLLRGTVSRLVTWAEGTRLRALVMAERTPRREGAPVTD